MKNKFLYLIILVFAVQNCSAWKKNLIQHGSYDIAIKNAVIDFCNTSSLANKDKTFYVNYKGYDSIISGVSIFGDVNKIYLLYGIPQSRVPNQYFEFNKKLFYWYDDKKGKDATVIKKLEEYKVIDSITSIKEDMGYIKDEDKKGVNYFFCKDNLLIYKKEKSSTALPRKLKNNLICR